MKSDNGRHLYQIGEFQLNTEEGVLLRDGEPVAITPKMFDVLNLLVSNRGRIVGKDELLDTVWAGSIVEEGNLAVTIRLLRKVLGDDAHTPRYIQTVARRGYRFVGPVEKIRANGKSEARSETASPAGAATANLSSNPSILSDRVRRPVFIFLVGLIVLFTVSSGALYFWQSRSRPLSDGLSFLRVERLSDTGNSSGVSISPDGKLIAYSSFEGGKSVIWLRQLTTGKSVQIASGLNDTINGLSFSRDGEFLYYYHSRGGGFSDLSKISILGGTSTKIFSNVHAAGSFSPDGRKFAFVRFNDGVSSMAVANSDGTGENVVLTLPKGQSIVSVDWAPQGNSIAYAAGKFPSRERDFAIMELDLVTGAERPLTEFKWNSVGGLHWLEDNSGIMANGRESAEGVDQVWLVRFPSGEARQISFDSTSLFLRGATSDLSKIIATRRSKESRLWIGRSDDATSVTPYSPAESDVAWANDSSVIFPALDTLKTDIWTVNPDGTNRRQLTNTDAVERLPVVSPDGKYLVYVGSRDGKQNIWRSGSGGGDATQLTNGEGEHYPTFTPDGKYVLFNSVADGSLKKVPVDGGDAEVVFSGRAFRVAASPDGSSFAYVGLKDTTRTLFIRSLTDGGLLRELPVEGRQVSPTRVVWADDGKSIVYLAADQAKIGNLYRLRLDDLTSEKLTNFDAEEIFDFAFSPDGNRIALVRGNWVHNAVFLTPAN
ncbi:MAG TPA: winged helix-turn-helix domain-containing protein [Pyrinomonadaceae bacterium]|nr:winged helix-turn-helix domain-containing protein [Pyrinomonadaceae bacterium]